MPLSAVVGPCCVFRIVLGRRKFLLFGEEHALAKDHILTPNQSYFDDFLIHEILKKNPTTRYDVFIESPLNADPKDYMHTTAFMIPRLMRRSFPKNTKIHYMDFRGENTVYQQDQTQDDTLLHVMGAYDDPWGNSRKMFFKEYKKNPWMRPHLIRVLILRTLLTHPRIRKQFDGVPTRLKTGIYTECLRLMDENIASLSDAIGKAGLSAIDGLKTMPSTLSLDVYRIIINRAKDVFCTIMDLYAMARFFKKTTGPNIIVYAGAAHVLNYVTILTALGGKITFEYEPQNPLATLPINFLGK